MAVTAPYHLKLAFGCYDAMADEIEHGSTDLDRHCDKAAAWGTQRLSGISWMTTQARSKTPHQRRGVLGLDVEKASPIRRLSCDDEGWPGHPCQP